MARLEVVVEIFFFGVLKIAKIRSNAMSTELRSNLISTNQIYRSARFNRVFAIFGNGIVDNDVNRLMMSV